MDEKIIGVIIQVAGGLGLFLYGMQTMSDGMQKLAGTRLKKIIGAATNNRTMATMAGMVVTGIIQSSSVTTVMVIGLVNAQIMNLTQALGIILGANIGTTVTGWILVVDLVKYGLLIAGVASIVYLFAKKDGTKIKANMVFGVGLVFFGLSIMSSGLGPVKEMQGFVDFFHKFQADSLKNTIFCAMVGMICTGIVQSSSATVGITITLANQGMITPETGMALVLGENIGTTITAYLASLGTNVNAKRAALAHFGFNLIGVIWVISIFPYYAKMIYEITNNSKNMGLLIATAHTMFNVTNVLLFLPFTNQYAKLLVKLIPDRNEVVEEKATRLDKRMLEAPAIALELVEDEIYKSGIVIENLFDDFETILKKRFDKENPLVKNIFKEESRMDLVQKEISDIAKEALILKLPMELTLSAKTSISLADEYESISDYIMIQTNQYLKILEKEYVVEENEYENIYKINRKIKEYFAFVNKTYKNKELENNLIKAAEMKMEIANMYKEIRDNYMERFGEISYSVDFIIIYIDILNTYRRINNHIFHVTEIIMYDRAED